MESHSVSSYSKQPLVTPTGTPFSRLRYFWYQSATFLAMPGSK